MWKLSRPQWQSMTLFTGRVKDGGNWKLESHVPADVSAFTGAESQPAQLVMYIKACYQTWTVKQN